jgi:NAD(P)-dependent dehydrogenase (short-subunit alcohol dehydrogenase family)
MNMKTYTACITGAASGLGFATAYRLAEAGFSVALLDIEAESLGVATNKIKQAMKNAKIMACTVDVSDEHAVTKALAEMEAQLGIPNVLVNCAGILRPKRTIGKHGPMPLSEYEQVIRVNLIGTFNMIRLTAAKMQTLAANESGERSVIINTSSIAAFEGQIGQAAYSASKAGVAGMTLPLAREFSTVGIRVMAIAPGLMETPMLSTLSEGAQSALKSSTLFPKRLGKPSEFAALVLHIIENPLLNGEVIRLDGGIRLPQ